MPVYFAKRLSIRPDGFWSKCEMGVRRILVKILLCKFTEVRMQMVKKDVVRIMAVTNIAPIKME